MPEFLYMGQPATDDESYTMECAMGSAHLLMPS